MLSSQAPVNLEVSPGTIPGEVIAAWEMPAGVNRSAIVDFAVEASRDSGQTWQPVDDGISPRPYASLTGLDPSQSVVIRVAAVSDGVRGPWSAPSEAVSPPEPNSATFVEFVHVGNPGNRPDYDNPLRGIIPGIGSVAYEYRIGKYEVTIGQYVQFLNAVAKESDPYGLWHPSMADVSQGGDAQISGIVRSGSNGFYTYTAVGPAGDNEAGQSTANRPISFVNWFDAARFANWMHNGRGSGSTETGAYTLNGQTEGLPPVRNRGARFSIPTESEWYKAAYYSPELNSGSGHYYTYATQSNAAPGTVIGGAPNQANYSFALPVGGNMLTDVGAFTGSGSFYGTFDQNGNVHEWLDNVPFSLSPSPPGLQQVGYRGGSFLNDESFLGRDRRENKDSETELAELGFRLVSVAPSSWFRTEIESAGLVTLEIDRAGNLRANNVLITFGGNPLNDEALIREGWTAMAAEADQGVNTVVLRHSSGSIHFLRFDADWRGSGGDGWEPPGTPAFFAAELAFGVDLDGDGLVTIENSGDVMLAYVAGLGDLRIVQHGEIVPVIFNGQPLNHSSLVAGDWNPMAAESDQGVNTIVLRHSSCHIHFLRFEADWRGDQADGWIPCGSKELYAAEVTFGVDLDGDGVVTIEASGCVRFAYDRDGNIRAGSRPVTLNGEPMNYWRMIAVGWQPMAADIYETVNTVVLKHASGHIHFWLMDQDWQASGGRGWIPIGSRDFHSAEAGFGADLSGDGVRTIEAQGSVVLTYDREGRLRVQQASAGAVDPTFAFLVFNELPVKYDSLKAAGWEPLAAEPHEAPNNEIQNTVLLRHSSGFLHFWRFDTSWRQVEGDGWIDPLSPEHQETFAHFGVGVDLIGFCVIVPRLPELV